MRLGRALAANAFWRLYSERRESDGCKSRRIFVKENLTIDADDVVASEYTLCYHAVAY